MRIPGVRCAFRGRRLEANESSSVIQSMVICKQPEVGGAGPSSTLSPPSLALPTCLVNSHDDSTFLYSNPLSALGFWFALEDCTPQNGCLSFVPGSHKVNVINKRLERVEGGGTKIVPVPEVEGCGVDWDAEGVDWKVEECKAGGECDAEGEGRS